MQNFKISSFVFLIIGMFALIDIFGYITLRNQIITNYDKDIKLLISDLSNKTKDMLTKLLFEYANEKEKIIEKHKYVLKAIESKKMHPLDINLTSLHQEINKDTLRKPYNINILSKALVIMNSTLDKELGFDVSFAKDLFDEHKRENVIYPCPPLFEKSTQSFFTFSDGYINYAGDDKAGVLQISYWYKSREEELKKLQDAIDSYPNVKDVKVFTFGDEGFVHDIIIHKYEAYKPSLQEFYDRIRDGKIIKEKLQKSKYLVEEFTDNGKHLKSISISSNGVIFDNTEVVFSIIIDDTAHLKELQNLNIWMLIVTVLGLVGIVVLSRVRKKEIKLNEQDKFIQSAMHEIKTPLSIITLNNQLRELSFGRDEFTLEIESALKTLQLSYDDMKFSLNTQNENYLIKTISLEELVKERVSYFKTIANSYSKDIVIRTNDKHCEVQMSAIELIRLIDNNISNTIKYAQNESTITVILKNNSLSFHNVGVPIKDTKKIFNKYFRENNVVGGHGLGLSIVHDIVMKYGIDVVVDSDEKNGTTFTYMFKCIKDKS